MYGTIGNDTTINQADFDGINLIAIQALEKRTSDLQKEIELQRRKIEQLENDYGDRIKKLEAATGKKTNKDNDFK